MDFPLFLPDDAAFPPAECALDSGLLAFAFELNPERLIEAYQNGIFPWYIPDDPLIMWWSPDPRFVLFPEKVKVSKNMRRLLRQQKFRITFDQDFPAVIRACQTINRPNQSFGSWITQEVLESYTALHHKGMAHSVEVWKDDKLVGGLYGCSLKKCFFGESMFSKVSDASKAGFLTLVRNLKAQDFELIDCQAYTSHLESLGAEMISRKTFLDIVKRNRQTDFKPGIWAQNFSAAFSVW